MAKNRDPVAGRWARLRFAIVGPLQALPPPRGALRREIAQLAQGRWTHPVTGDAVAFATSTIERWYYAARAARRNPVSALAEGCECAASRSSTSNKNNQNLSEPG